MDGLEPQASPTRKIGVGRLKSSSNKGLGGGVNFLNFLADRRSNGVEFRFGDGIASTIGSTLRRWYLERPAGGCR